MIFMAGGTSAALAFLVGRTRQSRVKLQIQTVNAFRLGDGEEGERLFADLVTVLSGVRQHRKAATDLMAARAYGHALQLANKVLVIKPDDKGGQRLKVMLHGKMAKADAVGLLKRWLEEYPKDYGARMVLVELLMGWGRHDGAMDALHPLVENDPEDLTAQSLMGRVLFAAGEYDRAAEHLEKAKAIREKRHRETVSIQGMGGDIGYDFGLTAEGQWEEERDGLLLEQIRTGEASARIATMDDRSP